MKPHSFNYSVLAVGIVAAMNITTANAATPTGGTSGSFNVTNKATASYTVAGNTTSQNVESNVVTVTVSETGSFSLVPTIADGNVNDDFNTDLPINAQTNSTVDFTHTLTNAGNVNDTYTVKIANATGDNFDYNLTNSVIKYQKVDASGATGTLTTVANGGTIALAPGEKALITVTAQSDTKRAVDANGILTVTAESAYLKAKTGNTAPTTYTATNTDNAKSTAPIYKIVKSAQTNLNNKTLDLNNANAYVDYTVTVKNEGNIDGTYVVISDALPSGLVAIKSVETNYVPPTTTSSNGSANVTPAISSDGKTITVTGQNVKINETITVTFRAKKATGATATSSFVNFAVVKDNTKSDTNANNPDITDSSGDAADTTNPDTTYETVVGNDYKGKDDNTNATVTTTSQTRLLAITPGISKEIALVTPATNIDISNTYTYTVTNNGTDVTEAAGTGTNASAVKLSIKPTATKTNGVIDDPNISITRVFVDANGNGIFDDTEIELTGVNGIYELNAATPFVTGSTTNRKGLAPGESVKIGVQVESKGTGSNNTTGKNNIGDFETLTLSVVPNGAVSGTAAPTPNPTTTSTTTLQGVDLKKFQIAAACGTNPAVGATNWSTGNVTATAAQCIYYKLEAKNTFTDTTKVISNLVVSDTLANTLTYQTATFTATPTATNQSSGQLVQGTFATLAANTTGNIIFSAKPSQTGTN